MREREPMTSHRAAQETNMAIVRRLLEEGFGQGLIRWLPHRIAPDYVGHLTNGDHYGPEGVRIDIQGYRSMVGDLTVSIEDLFADCDKVARRFTMRGISRDPLVTDASDGTPVLMTGVAIDHLVDGLMVESWVQIGPVRKGS